jgi:hypothetical protein
VAGTNTSTTWRDALCAVIFADKSNIDSQNLRMTPQTTGLRVASIVFALFAIGHIVRLLTHSEVVVGACHIPMWVSVVTLIIAGGLSIWMWRLASKT